MTELFANVRAERGMALGLRARRTLITLFALIALAALADVFGQGTSTSTAQGPGVTMAVAAPATVRGGLYYQATIDVTVTADVQHPRLVLDSGWVEGVQVNSIEPAAESESSRDGLVVLSYGELKPGDRLKIWLQFQVDPTSPGQRSHGVELDDGTQRLARIDRDLEVLP
jgi:hypothetical protein